MIAECNADSPRAEDPKLLVEDERTRLPSVTEIPSDGVASTSEVCDMNGIQEQPLPADMAVVPLLSTENLLSPPAIQAVPEHALLVDGIQEQPLTLLADIAVGSLLGTEKLLSPQIVREQSPDIVENKMACDFDAAARTIQHAFATSRSPASHWARQREADTATMSCAMTDDALLAFEVDDMPRPVTPTATTAFVAAATPTEDAIAGPITAMPSPEAAPLPEQEQAQSSCDNTFSLAGHADEGLAASMDEMDKLFLEAKYAAEQRAEQDARCKFKEWVIKKTSLQEAIDESLRGYPEMHQKAHEIRLLFEKERDDVLHKLASSRREADSGRKAPFGNASTCNDASSFPFPYDLDDVDEGEAGDKENQGLLRPIPYGSDAHKGQNKRKDENNGPASEHAYSLNKNIKPFSPPAKTARIDK